MPFRRPLLHHSPHTHTRAQEHRNDQLTPVHVRNLAHCPEETPVTKVGLHGRVAHPCTLDEWPALSGSLRKDRQLPDVANQGTSAAVSPAAIFGGLGFQTSVAPLPFFCKTSRSQPYENKHSDYCIGAEEPANSLFRNILPASPGGSKCSGNSSLPPTGNSIKVRVLQIIGEKIGEGPLVLARMPLTPRSGLPRLPEYASARTIPWPGCKTSLRKTS
jgi:hypothetical protein